MKRKSSGSKKDLAPNSARGKNHPKSHRTVDRVTKILEEVVYQPGMTFAELVRALGAAKSSVHGFMQGLLARGWLYENNSRFYIGPAVYGLTLASGQLRAGLVTHADLMTLHEATGLSAFLGIRAGDNLIYVSEAGSDHVEAFEARSNIRRHLLLTAGGKALLAAAPEVDRTAYLRRCTEEKDVIDDFLEELETIQQTGIATNIRRRGTRVALATVLHNVAGESVASVTLVGPAQAVTPRMKKLTKILLKHTDDWARKTAAQTQG